MGKYIAIPVLILCSVVMITCSLFDNKPETDLEKKMDEAVAWANASKLTVSVTYPQEWGSSPQNGTGRCIDDTRSETPRKGYPFTVQFNANAAYGEARWRAYRTAALPSGSNWYINTASIKNALENIAELKSHEIQYSPSAGNKTAITVHISDAVTIIPWVEFQPRVVMSNPPPDASFGSYSRPPNKDITITFAAPVDRSTLVFGDGNITVRKLTEDGIPVSGQNGNMTDYFISPPVYDDDTYTLTMQSKGNIENNINIEVTLGTSIKSAGGEKGMAQPVVFSWRTAAATLVIREWQAVYNEARSRIEASWTLPPEAAGMIPRARHRINEGSTATAILNDPRSMVIEGVAGPDYGGVRDGRPAGGVTSYTIFLDLGEDVTRIKIWNIPGMSVSNVNPAIEIDTGEQFSQIREQLTENKGLNVVLTRNITLDSAWTPVGDGSKKNNSNCQECNEEPCICVNSFSSKFYGNGHTITVSAGFGFANNAYTGIFGYVQNAEIRDLAVSYQVNAAAGAAAAHIGGLAAYLEDSSVRNTIVTGADYAVVLGNSLTGSGAVSLGGIAGYIAGKGKIENCRAGLSLSYLPGTGAVCIGGIAGEAGEGDAADPQYSIVVNNGLTSQVVTGLIFDNITVAANITANKSTNDGFLYIGGAAGRSTSNTMRNISFAGDPDQGYIACFRGPSNVNYHILCGGLIGEARNISMDTCSFSGAIVPAQTGVISHQMRMGGLIGINTVDDDNNGSYVIHNSRAKGNIALHGSDLKYAGGILGESNRTAGTITITHTFFEDGDITIHGSLSANSGGFAGVLTGTHNIYASGSLGGSVTIDLAGGTANSITAGGFTSSVTGTVWDCFAKTDIVVRGWSINAGGFTGILKPASTIARCYATGKVHALGGDTYVIYSGGLVGYNEGTIVNCYASGNVLADKVTGTSWQVDAGGLVGNHYGPLIEYCFSTGDVYAQSSNNAYAGGIAGSSGSLSTGTVMHSAALGSYVFAAASGTRVANRIIGSTPTPITNNYAINSMLTGTGAYNAYIPGTVVTTGTATNVNGSNISKGQTVSTAFWETTLDMGSQLHPDSQTVWDFSTVMSLGHPVLRNLPGQR